MYDENEERACNCGKCKYCNACLSSDHDYEGDDYMCSRCDGAGCTACEE